MTVFPFRSIRRELSELEDGVAFERDNTINILAAATAGEAELLKLARAVRASASSV